MTSKCSSAALTLLRRPPASIRACARRPSPSTAPTRWSSTKVPTIEREDLNPRQSQSSASKGKERAVEDMSREGKSVVLERIFQSAEHDIESSKVWDETIARYPGLKPRQVSLVALLNIVVDRMEKARSRLSGVEVLKLHTTVLKADRNLQSIMAGQRRFQESSVAYTIMLKYAHRVADARGLKEIAKEAFEWKSRQSIATSSNMRKTPRFIHPRVAAAEQLSRLIRNLFVSMSIRRGVRFTTDADHSPASVPLPSTKPNFLQSDDDAMTISTMLRNRVGAFKLDRNEDGKEVVRLAKGAQISRYPLTHSSSRIRRINRMAERGKLEKWIKSGKIKVSEEQKDASRKQADTSEMVPQTSLRRALPGPNLLALSNDQEDVMSLFKSPSENEVRARQMEALRGSLQRWQKELSRRMRTRRYMIGVIRQFRVKPDVSDPKTIEAIKQILPAWLVLAILRLQIESGEPRQAEKAVEVYLKSLARVYPDKKISEVIPVTAERVHTVTSPLIPPIGSSLLNGLLRAHLNSGANDCFERMLSVVDEWTLFGKKFKKSVLKKPDEKGPGSRQRWSGSLVPSQDTVLILLEALRGRLRSYALGKAVLMELWTRWGIVGLNEDRSHDALTENKRHHVLKIPQQAFTRLLKWAQRERRSNTRQKRINEIIELEARWRQKAFGSQQSFLGASVEHKVAWKKALSSAREDLTYPVEDSREDPSYSSEEDHSREELGEEEEEEEHDRRPLYFTRN